MRAALKKPFPICRNGVERWAKERQKKREMRAQRERERQESREVILAKQRGGEVAALPFGFRKAVGLFVEHDA
jgi:hypothetical protein